MTAVPPRPEARIRRSALFVSGGAPEPLERFRATGADTLILDLEDTVTPARKPEARQRVAAALRPPLWGGTERAVRVNAPATAYFDDDLRAIVAAGPDALVIPKATSADQIREVDARVGQAEREAGLPPGSIRLLPLIETALGVLNAYPIAAAAPRVAALLLGHVDLSRDLGLREAGARDGTIFHARCQLVLAARAAGRDAIDAVFMNLADPDGFRAEAREGLRLGYAGKLLIDRDQVPLVHEVYTPSAEEVAYARRVVEAFAAQAAEGTGLFLLAGRLIDLPVVEAERSVLERARRAGLTA